MRRSVLIVLAALLSSTVAFADGVTRSYLVGTRHPARQSVQRIVHDDSAIGGRNIEPLDIVDAFRVDLTDDEANALAKSPEVAYVQPEVVYHAFGIPAKTASNELRNPNAQTTPYGVTMVNAPAVWPATRGASINVAVLDTGIDVKHPDLQTAYAGGLNTYFGDKKYPTATAQPIDDAGHGTHVSGTIAATDNNLGVVGVAPGVKLWMVKVLDSSGSGSTTKIAQGLQWVVQQKQSNGGDWIISMSLGSCQSDIVFANAVSSAINAGILVVAASGNHDSTSPDVCTGGSSDNSYHVAYPAAYPGVVAVAAVDSTSTVADFSNFGPEVALAAPGVDVLSTVPTGTGAISYVTTSSGSVNSVPLGGSPLGTTTDTFVNCGLGKTAADFPAAVNGHIALIQRGDVTFATKAKNAQAAGASAVIIYNKDTSDLAFTLTGDPADVNHVWPLTVAVSLADGQALLAHPGSVTITYGKDDYANYSGTSMATPHVAGVAALVWSVAPNVTAATVRQALLSTAHDLGDAGVDNLYGHGLVDALAAAKQLNPALFGNGAQPPSTPPVVGRTPGRRGH
jgi:subtilisin family serine protease